MASSTPKTMGVPTSTTQHLQGLLTRKTVTAEPKTVAQYFNHVADLVQANEELTALRQYNLKRRWKVAFYGHEAVLNRKKRSAASVSRPSVTGPAYLSRAPVVAMAVSSGASSSAASSSGASQSRTKSPVRSTPTPVAPAPIRVPTPPVLAPAPTAVQSAAVTKPAAGATALPSSQPTPINLVPVAKNLAPTPAAAPSPGVQPKPTTVPMIVPSSMATPMAPAPTPAPVPTPAIAQPIIQPAAMNTPQTAAMIARRADFVVGSRVMIRHTADLVACGARNLVGKTGRIVAVPQVYGQEVYSVYIDEHETMFQVPFNALMLISPPAPATMPINMQHQPPPLGMHQLASGGITAAQTPVASVAASAPLVTAPTPHVRPTPSIEDIKLEHSYQLHRLMQQQYREIQVLQQQYAECRLVNPAALPTIQKELSKLRLVHLSQVQTLKSKQALDLLGK
ncbi:hypothetical protein P43SY_004358 [Pythium insidiosum]|uniref:Uncharacterized protein n=1 Tax=Pythium insidiosum TaxID=114742 RepID=A0AAD5QAN1_PYTIN|nr:hypothetical protein P43SY_004358 [Pythium insidiosum]